MEELFVTRTSMPSFEEYCQAIRPLWDSHILTNMGPLHQQLQARLEDFLEGPVSLYANGHLALEALLEGLQLPRGSEVITSPFTFVSTTHALVREALEALARKHGLPLLYDAAHAFGVRYKGVPLVRYGDASILSFHATKVFSTIEGGAVCFADERFRQPLQDLSNFGIRDADHCEAVGGNAKLNEFQAAMGLCNLRHFSEEVALRRTAFEEYLACLPPSVRVLQPREGTEGNYAYCPAVLESQTARDRAFAALKAQGIHPRKYFYPLTSQAGCYMGRFRGHTPVAAQLASRVLCLPLFPGLPPGTPEKIASLVARN